MINKPYLLKAQDGKYIRVYNINCHLYEKDRMAYPITTYGYGFNVFCFKGQKSTLPCVLRLLRYFEKKHLIRYEQLNAAGAAVKHIISPWVAGELGVVEHTGFPGGPDYPPERCCQIVVWCKSRKFLERFVDSCRKRIIKENQKYAKEQRDREVINDK